MKGDVKMAEPGTLLDRAHDIAAAMCDGYCKWPERYARKIRAAAAPDEVSGWLQEEHCKTCPLMEFFQ